MKKITLLQGDITKIKVDVIVNAANSSLLGGGGVDGAIHRAGGKAILEDCRAIRAKQGKLETGKTVITTAGNLPSLHVIHTVGPVHMVEKSEKVNIQLANCYRNSLILAVENRLRKIAFPNISTGIYKFPKEKAAKIAYEAVYTFLENDDFLEEVIFVCFDKENFDIYQKIIKGG